MLECTRLHLKYETPLVTATCQGGFFYLIILVVMERTDWSITSSYGDGTREDFLFTYSDAEKWINTTNKAHSDGLLNMEFVKFQRKYIGILTTEENLLLSFFEFYRGGEFYYSNEQLAGVFWRSEKSIQRAIKTLIDKWFVDVSYNKVLWLGTMRKVSFHHTEDILSDERGHIVQSDVPILSDDIRNKEYKEYKEKHVSDFSTITDTDDGQNQKEERQRRSTKSRRKDYPADFEEIWKVYPQNNWRKWDIYKFWCEYSEEEHEQFLWGAKWMLLYWDYVRHGDVRMSQRMDRWMEWYVAKDKKEQLLDIISKLTTITDNDVKSEGLAKAKELYGENYVRRALIQCSKDIVLDFH